MAKKLSLFFFLVLFAQVFVLAQQKMILRPDNTLEKVTNYVQDDVTILAPSKNHAIPNHAIQTSKFSKSVNGLIDTLQYNDGSWNNGFIQNGTQWFMQWFKAPADLIVKKLGYRLSSNDYNSSVELKIVKVLWSEATLKSFGDKLQGKYIATANGVNGISAFPSNPEYNHEGWNSNGLGTTSPFDSTDIWSDGGMGAPMTPDPAIAGYQFVSTDIGVEPTILKDEIFGVAIKHTATTFSGDDIVYYAAPDFGYPGWKFYTNGRTNGDLTTAGWWSRTYTFDFAVEVDLIGNIPPSIEPYDKLLATLSEGPRLVTATIVDDNPSGGAKGVQSAVIRFSIDKGVTWNQVAMVAGANDIFSGELPGQVKGTTVMYNIIAIDVLNDSSKTADVTYVVFNPLNPTLITFNGYAAISGYPQSYYFGYNGATADAHEVITFPRDKWAYGKLTKELVDHYKNIFEITTRGPKSINNTVIREWLAASPDHNYLLAGDEYLGSITGWHDTTYAAGDFQYDILGVSSDHNDIAYDKVNNPAEASLAAGIAGTTLGDSLHLKVLALGEDSLLINPNYELTASDYNWLDGFEPTAGTVVDVTAKGLNGTTYNVGAHHTLTAGNKVVFLAFDPLSLDSPSDSYFWYGFDRVSPLVQALHWFGADVVGVEDQISGPATYQLAQNYPNPFNPSTKLNYAIEKPGLVTLKVYDVLGREVASLVNEIQNAGSHAVAFDASKLASGMYMYTLTSGSFSSTKKMMLLK